MTWSPGDLTPCFTVYVPHGVSDGGGEATDVPPPPRSRARTLVGLQNTEAAEKPEN